MSFNTIMLQLDIDRPVGPGVAFAKSIALKFDTDLIGFCAAEPRYVMPVGDSDMAIADEMRRQVDEIEDKLIKVKEDFFRQLDGDRRITWRGELGNPTQLLAINARATDLIVLNYPRPGPTDGCRTADPGTLLLSIGRPVLLAPVDLQPVKAEGVLVAWKDTREAVAQLWMPCRFCLLPPECVSRPLKATILQRLGRAPTMWSVSWVGTA